MPFDPGAIKNLYERKTRALEARGHAHDVASSVARTRDGLACDVQSGTHTIPADLPAKLGGTATAPTPSELMRCGLAACLAIGYRLWAARLDVPIEEAEVEVTCELDARGQLGVNGVPARWLRIAYVVRLTSDAPESDLRRVVDEADRLSPMLDNLDKAIELSRTLEVKRTTR